MRHPQSGTLQGFRNQSRVPDGGFPRFRKGVSSEGDPRHVVVAAVAVLVRSVTCVGIAGGCRKMHGSRRTVRTPRTGPIRSGLCTSSRPSVVVMASVRTALMAVGGMSQQHSTLEHPQHRMAKQTCSPTKYRPTLLKSIAFSSCVVSW